MGGSENHAQNHTQKLHRTIIHLAPLLLMGMHLHVRLSAGDFHTQAVKQLALAALALYAAMAWRHWRA